MVPLEDRPSLQGEPFRSCVGSESRIRYEDVAIAAESKERVSACFNIINSSTLGGERGGGGGNCLVAAPNMRGRKRESGRRNGA